MLEPQYKSADIKKIRQKRRSFYMKVELLVSIISSIEYDPVDSALTQEDLEAKVDKLNKIENEEYLASLRILTQSRKLEEESKPKKIMEKVRRDSKSKISSKSKPVSAPKLDLVEEKNSQDAP